MKTAMLVFVVALLCIGSLSALDYVPYFTRGYFSGDMAYHVQNDTLLVVVNDSNNPSTVQLKLQILNLDNNVHIVRSIDSGPGSLTKPTISVSENEIIVTYNLGNTHKKAVSNDMGISWDITEGARTFEISPFTHKVNDVYKDFSLLLPYPQARQNEFAIADGSNDLVMPSIYTENELSMNGTNVYYWGPDEIHGVVRCDSDLYIRAAGGGNNNGWPTFYDPVIISGNVISNPPAYPLESVFRGGLIENAPSLSMPLGVWEPNTQIIGSSVYEPNRILFLEVNGNQYSGMQGIVTDRRQSNPVYSQYPQDPLGQQLFSNQYAIYDTIWTAIPNGTISHANIRVNSKLWIKGSFSGRQNWSCADTLFIVGDILLANTTPGDAPNNNSTDFVSLISEQGVRIKYGYKDPRDSIRYHMARSDANPFYIYANIIAMGGTGQNPRNGLFDFEYQHPHPSVPAVNAYGQLWENIDIFRRRYPQTVAEPWPANIDYPWYNPLWPERNPYLERGTIKLWGSVFQRRRGFMHRALYDTEWPSGGVWDPANDYCGGTSAVNFTDNTLGINMFTQNFPGASGSGVGYKKQFTNDPRYSLTDFEYFGWRLGIGLGEANDEPLPPYSHFKKHVKLINSKTYATNGDLHLYAVNDMLFAYDGSTYSDLSQYVQGGGDIISIKVSNDGTYALIYQRQSSADNVNVRFGRINLIDNTFEAFSNPPNLAGSSTFHAILISNEDEGFVLYHDGTDNLHLCKIVAGQLVQASTWDVSMYNTSIANLSESRVWLHNLNDQQIGVLLQGNNPNNPGYAALYYTWDYYPVHNDDPTVPAIDALSFSAFPNPFREELKLELKGITKQKHYIEIYNLRGQKVCSLSGAEADAKGIVAYSFRAVDGRGKRLGSGVYVIKVIIDDAPRFVKRVSLN